MEISTLPKMVDLFDSLKGFQLKLSVGESKKSSKKYSQAKGRLGKCLFAGWMKSCNFLWQRFRKRHSKFEKNILTRRENLQRVQKFLRPIFGSSFASGIRKKQIKPNTEVINEKNLLSLVTSSNETQFFFQEILWK